MASTYQYPPLVAQVAADGAVAALGPKPGDAQIRHRHHQPAQVLHLQPSVETHDVDGLQVDASPFIYSEHSGISGTNQVTEKPAGVWTSPAFALSPKTTGTDATETHETAKGCRWNLNAYAEVI